MRQFVYLMFSFLSPKRAKLSKNENITERQKKKANLSEQTQTIYDNTLFGLVTQRPPFPV